MACNAEGTSVSEVTAFCFQSTIQSRRTIKKSEDLGLYGFLSLGLRPSPFIRRPQSQASLFLRPLPSQVSLFLKVYF
jgi:hypothetical protein